MISHHARSRSQQRSIRPEAIDAILAFGASRRRGGADVYFLDRDARTRAERELGADRYRRLGKLLDSYVVMGDDGTLITVAHRYHRLKF
ncbi:hypothetical protein [Sphingomonas sp. YL-JM2C]